MRPSPGLAWPLHALRGAALVALVAVSVGLGERDHEVGAVTESYARPTLPQLAAERCEAGEALIRLPSGELRRVDLRRGWASHTGKRPGRLVSLCLEP